MLTLSGIALVVWMVARARRRRTWADYLAAKRRARRWAYLQRVLVPPATWYAAWRCRRARRVQAEALFDCHRSR